MQRRARDHRLWRLLVATVGLLLIVTPLRAEQPLHYFLPRVNTLEPEVTPQVLRIARVVLQGGGADQNSDEYVQIRNVSTTAVALGGARLSGGFGLTTTRPYVFPATTLPAGASALLFSKVGNDNPEANLFYLDNFGNVWSPGQTAELRDTQDRLLSRFIISGPEQPTPTATVTRPLQHIEINDIVLRDPAFPDISEEYIQIRNVTENPISLTGWRIINASRPEVPSFVFPAFSLAGDLTISVFTAVGDDDLTNGDFYWDQTSDVWRVGDRAELRDPQGRLVSVLIVPNHNS